MSGNIQESIFEDAINTIEYVLDMQLFDFSNIQLLMHVVEIVFFYEVHLILIGLYYGRFLLFGHLLLWRLFLSRLLSRIARTLGGYFLHKLRILAHYYKVLAINIS